MVDELVYVPVLVSLGCLVFAVSLARYLPSLRRASNAYKEASEVLSSMLEELNSRASLQDKRIVDAQVRLDVLEDRWLRGAWSVSSTPSYRSPGNWLSKDVKEFNSSDDREMARSPTRLATVPSRGSERIPVSSSEHPSKVDVLVLNQLLDRRLTAPEVKGILGSSREHAARVMKSLADRGLIVRDASKKPYTYQLSDLGRDIVTSDMS
jgi:CRP-like cAMP-binding protein